MNIDKLEKCLYVLSFSSYPILGPKMAPVTQLFFFTNKKKKVVKTKKNFLEKINHLSKSEVFWPLGWGNTAV